MPSQHAKSTTHKQKSNAGSGCRKMEHFLTKPEDDLELAAMEATQTYHMLQENQSFASMECQTKIINTVFNVPKFQCASTKAAAIVEGVFFEKSKNGKKYQLKNAGWIFSLI